VGLFECKNGKIVIWFLKFIAALGEGVKVCDVWLTCSPILPIILHYTTLETQY